MLVTCHQSASPPIRLHDYHLEFGLKDGVVLAASLIAACKRATNAADIDWLAMRAAFNIYKNDPLVTATSYGTFEMNHDPRDGSANVEIAALCMGGEGVSVAGPWGRWPYTYIHCAMHAALVARVCQLKDLDTLGTFDAGIAPNIMQNGPISVVSTHGERAWQTYDIGQGGKIAERGYFAYSGDPNCRWDCIARDPSEAAQCATYDGALRSARATAAWIRSMAHSVKAAGITDMWGLDGPVTP
jgi:hypothetical protein